MEEYIPIRERLAKWDNLDRNGKQKSITSERAKGKSINEIAYMFAISRGTVFYHLRKDRNAKSKKK